ncbi:radical SAM protein [Methylogaea oryzae]|uniref:radical SAM protein n=1 Tax=Methylogaea oryzae TaxID=1295382 RepID=UPI0006CFD358|nr:radical SAM protein [Methylogaea oryzae]
MLELALAAAPNDRPLRELQRSLQTQTVDFGQTLTVDATPAKLRRVVIEVTTWCNLDCPGCFRTQSIAAGHWTNKHIAPETFAKIVANLPPCRQGVLHGIGEPTMHPRYLELVEIAKASGRFDSLVCNTNAQARNIDFYRAVIEKGLDFFQVSVDSLTPEVAAVTRAGTDVEKLRRNLAEFHRLGLPFSVQMVISRLNYDDIDLTLRALDAMGPCTVNIQPFVDSDATHNALSKDMAARFLDKIRHLAGQMVNLNINAGGFYHFGINRREPMCRYARPHGSIRPSTWTVS